MGEIVVVPASLAAAAAAVERLVDSLSTAGGSLAAHREGVAIGDPQARHAYWRMATAWTDELARLYDNAGKLAGLVSSAADQYRETDVNALAAVVSNLIGAP